MLLAGIARLLLLLLLPALLWWCTKAARWCMPWSIPRVWVSAWFYDSKLIGRRGIVSKLTGSMSVGLHGTWRRGLRGNIVVLVLWMTNMTGFTTAGICKHTPGCPWP